MVRNEGRWMRYESGEVMMLEKERGRSVKMIFLDLSDVDRYSQHCVNKYLCDILYCTVVCPITYYTTWASQ